MHRLAELFYNFNEISIIARLVLAALCGGIIGMERERKRRAAGFRTHILTAMGAAMTTLVGQYLLTMEISTAENFVADPLRLGAQVISGMGFIGAGAIIVTRRKQVKGLTTAAGLWTTAIIGLAAGAGCYLEVVFSTVFIILAEMLFSKAEYYLMSNPRIVNVFVDFAHTPDGLRKVFTYAQAITPSTASIITVFGSAGQRDTRKRPIFGEIADEYCDMIILTSLNL